MEYWNTVFVRHAGSIFGYNTKRKPLPCTYIYSIVMFLVCLLYSYKEKNMVIILYNSRQTHLHRLVLYGMVTQTMKIVRFKSGHSRFQYFMYLYHDQIPDKDG